MAPSPALPSSPLSPPYINAWAYGEKMSQEENKPASTETEDTSGVTRRNLIGTAISAGVGAAFVPLLSGATAKAATPLPMQTPATTETAPVTLDVNGQTHWMQLEPRVTLLDALREQMEMFGTKKGCDHGQCGACTVLVNGKRINSCLTLAIMHQGEKITTIEGIASGDKLHPVQEAFIENDAFQCGYCTPGQICSAVGLINEGHAKTDDEIREQMAGNICRCGAYPHIVKAVRQAMEHR